MLSRNEILEEIKQGRLKIEPFDISMVGNDSIDIRLGDELLISKAINDVIDVKNPKDMWEKVKLDEKGFLLYPHQFLLGSTLESISLPEDIAAFIEGRSSVGRLGLMIHVTAGVIHAGFGNLKPSKITLEMYSLNPNPLRIYPGIKIAQLTFHRLESKTEPYDKKGSYFNQQKPLPPKGLI